ncbi:hypothetical protein ABZP36_010853 [Zizania latifolia]
MEAHPPAAASGRCLPSLSSPVAVPQPLPNVEPDHMQLQLEPPSEDEMAAWLYQIDRGEEFSAVAQPPAGGSGAAGAGYVAMDHQPKPAMGSGERWTAGNLQSPEIMMEKLLTDQEGTCGACTGTRSESNSERKKTSRASKRSSQYAETHSLTEKRRRCKINEKLKTLQQIVPGCDKSNQASTLDQTIQYTKSLQQHVQAMSVGCCSTNPAAAAVYAILQPPPPYMRLAIAAGGAPAPGMVLRSTCPPIVQFAAPAVPPLFHHPAAAVVMMPAAGSPIIYPAAAAGDRSTTS